MYNFFANNADKNGDYYYITGVDYNHIKNVLRMKIGDTILVSDNGISNLCEIKSFDNETAVIRVIEENYQNTNLPVDILLFQGLPKSDKMELIIQKAVELGVNGIIPVEMKRCVVKLDDKKKKSKQARWQSIAESAAKQSKRSIIPKVYDVISYKQALNTVKELDLFLMPYENENGMSATKEALAKIKKNSTLGILIGPEGGFEDSEVQSAKDVGAISISLGKRILRTETAAITSVAICMLHIEMNIE